MSDVIASVRIFISTKARDVPYLGALREGETPNAKGYFVRKGNRTVYSMFDRTVVVEMRTRDGVIGWGETYGAGAPAATAAILSDLLIPFVVGRGAHEAAAIHDDLYDLMRVRGYGGGFYLDALAALDIALWDIAGKQAGVPLSQLLGAPQPGSIEAYVSGLPASTREERAAMARDWLGRGFSAFKYASPVSDDGVVSEIETLREALGPEARISCDMHWAHTAQQAIDLIERLKPFDPWFAEAPVKPEDISGLVEVAAAASTPIAAGEEWRTVFELGYRLDRGYRGIFQPEMGHIGVTEFVRMVHRAEALGMKVIPHATIGLGIFLAASLHASAAMTATRCHEFQHSVFEPNRRLLTGDMDCIGGTYVLPTGPGLGVEPNEEARSLFVEFPQ